MKKLKLTAPKPLESDIQKAILRYLELLPNGFFWRNNSTGIYDPVKGIYRKARSKYAINGVSDILGVYKGRFVAIEVKRDESCELTEEQERFLFQVNLNGGLGFKAWSVEEVKLQLKAIN